MYDMARKLCSEKAVIENEQEFEKSQEGFDKLIKWLESMFE